MPAGDGGAVSVTAAEGIEVAGDNGTLNSSIRSVSLTGSGNAGALTVQTGELILEVYGDIDGDSYSAGKGATVRVTAGTAAISEGGDISAAAFSSGAAGSLTVGVTHALMMSEAGVISATNSSTGAGGNLQVTAGSLSIDGSATPTLSTGIFAQSNPGAAGKAGDLTVDVAGALTISGGGEIEANAYSSGAGGNLSVTAASLSIDGSAAPTQLTGLAALSERGATGNAGSLTVDVAGALAISGSGEINASTLSSGTSGALNVTAGSLTIDGSATAANPNAFLTGIVAESNVSGTGGSAGALTVHVTDALTIGGGGEIVASTYSSGAGGNLEVAAASLSIDGSAAPTQFTGLAALSNAGATGGAGNLTVDVTHALTLSSGGEISAGHGHFWPQRRTEREGRKSDYRRVCDRAEPRLATHRHLRPIGSPRDRGATRAL